MRNFHRRLAFVSMAALVLAAAAALAQAPGQKEELKKGFPLTKKVFGPPSRISVDDMVERIMTFDKNKDGKITMDELPERMHHLITQGDTNKDGALDQDEIRKLATTLAAAPGEPGGPGFGFGPGLRKADVRVGAAGPAPGLPAPPPGFPGPVFAGPGFPPLGDMAGVVDDLKLSGQKKDQALAAVKAHQEDVRKLMDKARAELLAKMKDFLSEEELNDFQAALDRPRGGATFFNVEKKRDLPKKK